VGGNRARAEEPDRLAGLAGGLAINRATGQTSKAKNRSPPMATGLDSQSLDSRCTDTGEIGRNRAPRRRKP